ncbi:hypothetical protein J4456_04670 [Candidatus Pacearchaeota archaeon]|nr:hypothetical protein [Candidatus Pacearchaeota archaeon]
MKKSRGKLQTDEESIHDFYMKTLSSDLERVLHWTAILKHVRNRVNNPFNSTCDPIHLVDADEIILRNSFFCFATSLKKYLMNGKRNEDGEINHYRLVRILDDKRFDKRFSAEYGDLRGMLDEHPEYFNVDGFVAEESLYSKELFVPVVYIRENLLIDLPRFSHVKKHEDSHAFSKGWKKPEELVGYSTSDDGEGELLVRHELDEFIANLEVGEELQQPHALTAYTCGERRAFNCYKRLSEINKEAVHKAREKISPSNHTDLAYMLRVLPAQKMGVLLHYVVDLYNEQGLPSIEFIDK